MKLASGMATKTLLKNTWFLSSSGFKYGYVFINGSRIEDAGEGDPPPEYELVELMYDFEGDALVTHGYSVVVDIVEYVLRGLDNIDLSIFTREELRKLANVGLVNSYINGVTLPVAITSKPEVVADVARENMMRIALIVDRGTVSRNPFLLLLEVDNGKVYFEDRVIGEYNTVICKPKTITSECRILDTRQYGNTTTAIEEAFMTIGDAHKAIELLTNTYRLTGVDSGYIEKNSASDLIIHDMKNPLKTLPLVKTANMEKLVMRAQQPDIVFIGGDIFYDHGENLAIPVVKIHEIIKKRVK